MELNVALTLIAATAILVAIPGPNVALIVANTITHGLRFGYVTVVGTTIGVALQVIVVVLGLAAVLDLASSAFGFIKWVGVVYLICLGLVSWRRGAEDFQDIKASRRPMHVLFWEGLSLAMINPKTLLFNAAFLPQFANGEGESPMRLLLPAILYLCVIFLGDLAWAASARSAKPALMRLGRLRHRLSGALFFVTGIGLAMARQER